MRGPHNSSHPCLAIRVPIEEVRRFSRRWGVGELTRRGVELSKDTARREAILATAEVVYAG